MTSRAYIDVCGKCNLSPELHPHEHCPYEHLPIMYEGRRIGWRLIDKKKNKNGRKEKAEKSTA